MTGAHSHPGSGATCRGGRAVALLGLLLAAGAAAGWATWPQDGRQPHIPPTTRTPGCIDGGCHAETMSHDFLHGPTAVAACTMCHEYSNPAAHDFELKSQGRELCDFCHINMTGTEGPVVHEPVATGDCLSCHNPHGAKDRKLMRRDSAAALCADCHEDAEGAHVHDPVAQGDCLSCHAPHTAQHAALLPMPRRELCLSCHEAVGSELMTSAHIHDPVQGDCMDCHDAHASETPGVLLAPAAELCASCHEPTAALAHAAPRGHSPVFEGRACLNCHLPHASRSPALQFDDPTAACLECHKPHEDTAPAAKEKPNPAAPVFRDTQPRVIAADHPAAPPAPDLGVGLAHMHGPVADSDCAACHDVHGAEHTRLLSKPLAEGFYAPFSEQAYALCFSCHDKKLVMETPTAGATRFRDGEVNLHTAHVRGEQGRTCRACHTTHASETPAQIRKTAAFGQWQLPLNFTLTENGGSCAPGCHKPASYQRGPADGAAQAP